MTIKDFIRQLIPDFLIKIYHYKLALLGAIVFGFPSRGLIVIGVTGTSGKSSTVNFLTGILEEAGNKVASISTIRFKIGEKEWENKYKMTMPGRFVIQKFLRQAKNAGCKYVVLEVTSQGVEQFRHKFINFDTAVFTNLSREHIESHGGFENYRNAKLKFFRAVRNMHIINADDKNAKYFLDIPANKKIIFSLNDAKNINFKLRVLGEFNVQNALAAICVAKAYGVEENVFKKALERTEGIPGRMEIVFKNPLVIIDYAHTPEQLESAYKSLRERPLICVLGSCGGGRDKFKRPMLGKIAKQYCKKIIITNEDPYDEDPMEIINEVASGAEGVAQKIPDRRDAIKTALKMAAPPDTVIITGKGSEPWMCVKNNKKIPWDDRKVAREELAKMERLVT